MRTKLSIVAVLSLCLAAVEGCKPEERPSERPSERSTPEASGEEVSTTVESEIEQNFVDDASLVKPLEVGDTIPFAVLRDISGRDVDTDELFTQKPTVLIIYRGGWCPFCTRHLARIETIIPDIEALGYQLIAVSPDQPSKLEITSGDLELPFKVYSDSNLDLISGLGLAFRVDDETFNKYKNEYQIDLEAFSGEDHHLLPVPAVYIVDDEKKIEFAYYNPDYKVRVDADEILAQVRKLAGSPLSEESSESDENTEGSESAEENAEGTESADDTGSSEGE
ncbi:MAG: AhpC/TSA family protein [Planctomycetes bacterium]|nr:AhpC/TSA family protein [Planctomycetota bacterium]